MLRTFLQRLKARVILNRCENAGIRLKGHEITNKYYYNQFKSYASTLDPDEALFYETISKESAKEIADTRDWVKERVEELRNQCESAGDTTSNLYKKILATSKKLDA